MNPIAVKNSIDNEDVFTEKLKFYLEYFLTQLFS